MMGFALSLQVLPPLFDFMLNDVYFTNSQAGMLMGAYAIPGVFLPFLVAYLSNYDCRANSLSDCSILSSTIDLQIDNRDRSNGVSSACPYLDRKSVV